MANGKRITELADEYTASARAQHEAGELDFLEVDIMTAPHDKERFRVRFLVTFGGPRVEVVVDSREGVTYYDSEAVGGRVECDLRSDDREFWEGLAQDQVGCL